MVQQQKTWKNQKRLWLCPEEKASLCPYKDRGAEGAFDETTKERREKHDEKFNESRGWGGAKLNTAGEAKPE